MNPGTGPATRMRVHHFRTADKMRGHLTPAAGDDVARGSRMRAAPVRGIPFGSTRPVGAERVEDDAGTGTDFRAPGSILIINIFRKIAKLVAYRRPVIQTDENQ